MFTWICPKCGREVPPSMQDCPNCAPAAQAAPPAQPVAPPTPPPQQMAPAPPPPPAQQPMVQGYAPQPTYQPPVQQPTYQPPAYLQPVYQQPEPSGLPSWLVSVLVFVGMIAVGSVLYFYVIPSIKKDSGSAKPAATAVENGAPANTSSLAKQVEVTGVRITEDAKKKLLVRLIVINHSGADMGELKLTITLTSDSGKGAATVLGTFPVVVTDLGPFEAKEAKGNMKTNLRAYELPDWQFLRATAELSN